MTTKYPYSANELPYFNKKTWASDKNMKTKYDPKWNKDSDSKLKWANWKIILEKWKFNYKAMGNKWD